MFTVRRPDECSWRKRVYSQELMVIFIITLVIGVFLIVRDGIVSLHDIESDLMDPVLKI